jgi:hypothetical protein
MISQRKRQRIERERQGKKMGGGKELFLTGPLCVHKREGGILL